jgi:hypothetical protein
MLLKGGCFVHFECEYHLNCSVADINLDVKRLRNARYIQPDKIVRPFSQIDADGYKIFVVCKQIIIMNALQ